MSITHLRSLVKKLNTAPIAHKPSPASHPRRAAVAAILRWKCNDNQSTKQLDMKAPFSAKSDRDFTFVLNDFMNRIHSTPGQLELLFIQRAKRAGDIWSGHVALPGGKSEENETDVDTAMREVEEETGLDLNRPEFLLLGKLDDKKLISADNKRMMIIVPFVFLQLSWDTPPLTIQGNEVAAAHWVNLPYLISTPISKYDPFGQSLPDAQHLLHYRKSDITQVPSILLPPSVGSTASHQSDDEPIILWGLTLQIVQQLIGFANSQVQQDIKVIADNI